MSKGKGGGGSGGRGRWSAKVAGGGGAVSVEMETGASMDRWVNRTFAGDPPTPSSFRNAFSIIGVNTHLEVSTSVSGLNVRFRLNDAATGGLLGTGTRRIVQDKMATRGAKPRLSVIHDDFYLQSGAQGRGIGSRLLAKAERSYKSWGVHEIRIPRAAEVGRYAWAKAGFRPTNMGPIRSAWKTHLSKAGKPTAGADRATMRQIVRHSEGKRFLTGPNAPAYAATKKL